MNYQTIHTNYGLIRMSQAEATGVPINLTAMAVGDGKGNPVVLSPAQIGLVRETYRAAPNRVYQDPANRFLFTAELVIPASIGGFTAREVGIFDDQGGLFAVANVPDSYKPLGDGSEGSFGDTILRMQFVVTNATVVTLQIDPNVAVATQQWISNTITLPYLLPGGTTGQVLIKKSNINGDVEWADPTVANVAVSTVEEHQTIAVGQMIINLMTTTTVGLVVYIEGTRLKSSDWTADPVILTKLTLNANTFTSPVTAILVQNEPANFVPNPLIQSKNLSDVADVPIARANLSVYSKSETDQKMQAGGVCYYATTTAPSGWLKANGAAISRTAYVALFAAIGTLFGVGDGFTTFNLPDLRGEFLRGFDDSRGLDVGRTLGSVQTGQNLSHTHAASSDNQGSHNHGGTVAGVGDHQHISPYGENTRYVSYPWGSTNDNNHVGSASTDSDNPWPYTSPAGAHSHSISTDGAHAHNISVASSGGTETRPRNVALLACIKY